ncbi:MAG: MlaD family protein [Thermodesulfobacteriota bacterium]|jgi:paraquat-inducible protein B|nr:MAG: MlaD family protein [Thermodesulfobacteriota bacterium]
MTENVDLKNIPQALAEPKKRRRFSVVWIIPILAALVALGIAVQRILSEGPTISIVFKTTEGVEEGKTYIRYKDVNIGQVKTVKLSKDFAKVVVTAKIDKSAAGLIVEDAKFWIEKPRVTLSGISGIGTLLSGNYIGFDVGKSKKARRNFIGLEVPPAIKIDEPGRRFVLQADNLGSLGIGSPLYYRRLNVGQIIGYDLAADGRSVNIKVFVNAPYDTYVTPATRFWQASGVDVSLGANGITVETQSVLSLLIGGIAFEAPSSAQDEKPATEGSVFTLYDNHTDATAKHETIVQPYVLYFNEPVRGLSVGAPVTFFGLPVGEVTAVGLDYNPATDNLRPRVDVALYPMRMRMLLTEKSKAFDEKTQQESERRAVMQKIVDRGLRAQLRSGSLVTGQLYVAFDFFPDAPKIKINWTKSPPELPVMPGGLQDLQNKINSILAKIDKMPLEAIGVNLKKLIATTDQTLKRADTEITPELKTVLEDLKRVLESTNANLVGKDTPVQQDLRDALQEMTRAAQAIRVFTDYLERHPEALIRGKTKEKP